MDHFKLWQGYSNSSRANSAYCQSGSMSTSKLMVSYSLIKKLLTHDTKNRLRFGPYETPRFQLDDSIIDGYEDWNSSLFVSPKRRLALAKLFLFWVALAKPSLNPTYHLPRGQCVGLALQGTPLGEPSHCQMASDTRRFNRPDFSLKCFDLKGRYNGARGCSAAETPGRRDISTLSTNPERVPPSEFGRVVPAFQAGGSNVIVVLPPGVSASLRPLAPLWRPFRTKQCCAGLSGRWLKLVCGVATRGLRFAATPGSVVPSFQDEAGGWH